MTAALEGGELSAARPGHALPPGRTRYPFYRRLGGPQGRSGRAENLVPIRIRSRTVQYTKKYADKSVHTHTHTYIYIYIYIGYTCTFHILCKYVLNCVLPAQSPDFAEVVRATKKVGHA